jgi:hypothetical protein
MLLQNIYIYIYIERERERERERNAVHYNFILLYLTMLTSGRIYLSGLGGPN